MKHFSEIRKIENKHVQMLTGKTQRTCSRIIGTIRKKLGMKDGEELTIATYARFRGLCPVTVCEILGIDK